MGKLNLITVNDSRSPISEAYKTLRTNMQFSSYDKQVQTIVITSSGPGEGKSTVSSNLAVVFAQSGHKTILIDCDLRRSKLHRIFQISNNKGLSNFLAGQCNEDEIINSTPVDNLSVIPSGTRPPNPSELLASNKMQSFLEKLKEEYQYIILDTPPVIMVTDAQVLSRYSEGVVLVICADQVDRGAAIRSKELLLKVNARILGVVLNKVKSSGKGYYDRYSDYYYNEGEGKKRRKLRDK
ncbi:MAG: CpsD/CapB family tyrosine-protein kinase [Solirubrobacterales bacterium]